MSVALVTALRAALVGKNWREAGRLLEGRDALTVPVDVFQLFPDCPVQRDTERRAKLWLRERDTGHETPHRDVVVAATPNSVMAIDGHTRRYLWANGLLDLPPGGQVSMTIKRVNNLDAVIHLYSLYDNPVTQVTGGDGTASVERLTGQVLQSPYLRGSNAKALSNAHAILTGATERFRGRKGSNMERGLQTKMQFHPVMLKIDRIAPNAKTFNAQILTAAIVATVVDGAERALGTFFGPYVDEANHHADGLAKNAFFRLAALRQDRYGPMFHYSGSDELENIQRVLRFYEEHMFRFDRGLSLVFERFEKPRLGRSHKGLDLGRYMIGDTEMQRRLHPQELRRRA